MVPVDPRTIYGGSNGCDCSPKVLMLAVNHSTEETLVRAYLSALLINLYAKVCIFCI